MASLNEDLSFDYASILILESPLPPKQAKVIEKLRNVLCFGLDSKSWEAAIFPNYIVGFIKDIDDPKEVAWALEEAHRVLQLRHENDQLRLKLEFESIRRREIMESALELSSDRDLPSLCEKTLRKLRRVLDSEAATLFLFDQKENQLRFRHVQNEKLELSWEEFRIPVNEESIVGACAARKKIIHLPDVYNIPEEESFRFNKSFDEKTGFRTRNMLSIPLLKSDNELVGVVQVINSKKKSDFSNDEMEIARALSMHIAVALETALLYENIENLFEGFIKASVTAIESRDPTTSGHSQRVADLTEKLARIVHDSNAKEFRSISFSEKQLKEIRYASLLHDFGKIGVPENVLVKAKKLYPHELQEIARRMMILKLASPGRKKEFQELWESILRANEPSVVFEDVRENLQKYILEELAVEGESFKVLDELEWKRLSIRKGSLDDSERAQIESHVVHTKKFLENIPWTRDLSRITEIAASHHERPNGKGYPQGLTSKEIPFESQVMSVADVFDALTAMDRPYKKAVALPRAIEILRSDANNQSLNSELVELFIEQQVYKVLESFKKA